MTHRPVGFLFLTVMKVSYATAGVATKGQMARFFCPGCWEDSQDGFGIIPQTSSDEKDIAS